MKIDEQQLFEQAKSVLENAYAPYSKYQVSAAIVIEDGTIYTGVNIENASYGLTNCAERTAIFKAVSEGHTSVEAIVIVNGTTEMSKPCGACRQVMSEFMGPDSQVFLANVNNDYHEFTFEQILPLAFSDKDMD